MIMAEALAFDADESLPESVVVTLQVAIDEATGEPIGVVNFGALQQFVSLTDAGDGRYIVVAQGSTPAQRIGNLNEFLTTGVDFEPSDGITGVFPRAITLTIIEESVIGKKIDKARLQ